MTRIAVMQPYFMPYTGYFRLFTEADVFVVYDDAQFPREGWVHRNQLINSNNELAWLTLPLRKKSLATKINEMEFVDNASEKWESNLRKFPVIKDLQKSCLKNSILNLGTSPVDYITNCLRVTLEMLDIPFDVKYSSQIDINKNLKGQDKVIEIVKYFGAKEYVNSPGGRCLYDVDTFLKNDIKLTFLPEYTGTKVSILQRLLEDDISNVLSELK